MPRRENINLRAGSDGDPPLHAAVVRPDGSNGAPRPLVTINRGLACSEAEIDLLDALAGALAGAGFIAALIEPRPTHLILDDFEAFTLADEIADVVATLGQASQLAEVEGARIGLLGWSLGAVAAGEAALQAPSVRGVCLLNPATAAYIAARGAKPASNGSTTLEPLPGAYIESVAAPAGGQDGAGRTAVPPPLLVVHAAADRIVAPHVSLAWTRRGDEVRAGAERLLIARADHALGDAAARAAAFERIVAFFATTFLLNSERRAVGAAT